MLKPEWAENRPSKFALEKCRLYVGRNLAYQLERHTFSLSDIHLLFSILWSSYPRSQVRDIWFALNLKEMQVSGHPLVSAPWETPTHENGYGTLCFFGWLAGSGD